MLILYPDIKPYATHRLRVDDTHELYIEECGMPDGIPVIYLHGGPGAGISPQNRCFFDPEIYRIILFDQRGAGISTAHACIKKNTTQDLLEDIDKIRHFLGVERCILFGGAWGATLALLYAQANPANVIGMILRGVCLWREQDIDWFFRQGANLIYPEYWEDFLSALPRAARSEPVIGYHNQLTGANELMRMQAAKAWALWESRCATFRPNHAVVDHFTEPLIATALACISVHYLVNKGFIEPDQILSNVAALHDIPCILVHGRYDMVCPLSNAHELRKAWPSVELHIIRDAGHGISDPAIIDALVKATRIMAKRCLEAD